MAATGTLEGIISAGRRYVLPDVVKIYEQIAKDERFHVGLGRLLLDFSPQSSLNAPREPPKESEWSGLRRPRAA